MSFLSTRGGAAVTASQAILYGLAPDGGLYVPAMFPPISMKKLGELTNMDYRQRASTILRTYLEDFSIPEIDAALSAAYDEKKFDDPAIAPMKKLDDDTWVLELFHGPTLAFKDMALQLLPHLTTLSAKKNGEEREVSILVATSGDTGKAALEGYRDVDGVKITVFYPVDGVSPMQKRQMTTQRGENVNVCSVYGNFDDAQSGVKTIFADEALAQRAEENGFFFSSANSINWGRLAPQIVYYISAYCDLVNNKTITLGDTVNVCVPTGNFGNIFAAYIAREMGLPLGKLICASNANCVLTDFIRTGVYDRTRPFYKTMSPSMDILISSNLERLLFLLGGSEMTADCMAQLSENGKYTAPASVMEKLREVFAGFYCTEEETASVIRSSFADRKYLCDTHTAVGLGAAEKYRRDTGDERPIILASTASPYKFPADVLKSLGKDPATDEPAELLNALHEVSGTAIPEPLAQTLTLPVRFTKTVDPADMASVIFE